ncbi:GUN4 domain-containing protein [Nodularia chucula]|uniref:GUN4 domain-containing protein n=1 Tax=Nodularia chucula TaxID=3093667 RepID=UPI0039C623B4
MRSLFILGFSLATVAANQLSVLAQTRQPTNAEINRLRQELQESIRYGQNNSIAASYVEDRRTQAEKNERESFVRAWSKIEPQLAPFMGAWRGYESGRYIYPSNTKGRVCVVVQEGGTGTLNTGVLFNGVIRKNNGGLLFKEGNFLGAALLEKGRFVRNYDIPFHHARPLQPLTKMLDSLYDASPSQKNQLAQQFKAAGCTTSVASLNSQNISNNNSSTDDTTAILNLVKGWGAVGDISIINNYAILSYFYGQNGGNVTFRRTTGKWNIIDGGRNQGNCQDINCLVNKGVPRDVATQLLNYLENSNVRQTREINAFRQDWAKKNKTIAPFLGYWKNQRWPDTKELTISFWPSSVANKLCVIGISENDQYVKTGIVSGKDIRIENQTLTLFQNNDNFGDFISDSNQKYYLINPSKLNTWYFNTATKQKLRDAGCTDSINTLNPQNTSNNNSSLAVPQAEPSIVSSSTPVMFQKLETLLQAGKWKDADLETWELMKKVTKREKEGELTKEDYQNFPRKELQIMDQLWLKYSNGKFGFSVQKQIWLELGGKYNGQHYDYGTFLKLVERVGWRRNRTNLSYDDFTFSTNAPRGHLPTGELASGRGQTGLLFSRL